jgi:hypothetical protein
MQEKSASFFLRKIILMLLVLAVVAVTLTTGVRRAEAVSNLYTCTFYSDATYTVPVGGEGGACCGGTNDWGITTPYPICHPLACTNALCGDGPLD